MYILYKNPIQLDTLDYVRFLHYNNINATPKYCIERNWGIEIVPTIKDLNNKKIYKGLPECIKYYASLANTPVDEFKKQVQNFKIKNPDYKIHNI